MIGLSNSAAEQTLCDIHRRERASQGRVIATEPTADDPCEVCGVTVAQWTSAERPPIVRTNPIEFDEEPEFRPTTRGGDCGCE